MSESRSTLRRVAQMKGEPMPEFYATTLANTTDQIATTTATRGDITSHEGDATIPAVVQDAQRYDWRDDLDSIEACEEVWECADGCCTEFMPRHNDECIRLAAYIESLEAERDALRLRIDRRAVRNGRLSCLEETCDTEPRSTRLDLARSACTSTRWSICSERCHVPRGNGVEHGRC